MLICQTFEYTSRRSSWIWLALYRGGGGGGGGGSSKLEESDVAFLAPGRFPGVPPRPVSVSFFVRPSLGSSGGLLPMENARIVPATTTTTTPTPIIILIARC